MSEVHKTPREILANKIYYFLDKKRKAGLPSKRFLDNNFLDLIISCQQCYKREEKQTEKVRGGLSNAEKIACSFVGYKDYIREARDLCETCEAYGKPVPTIFNFIKRTLDKIYS